MAENILGVSVTPTIPTSDGLFFNHGNQPDPTPNFAQIQQACNQAAGTTVNTDLLKAQFSLFMGQYNPYVSNDIYKSEVGGNPTDSTSTQTTTLAPYYNSLFIEAFQGFAAQYAQKSQLASAQPQDQQQSLQAFQTYMATNPATQDTRFRQKNVQIWQFTYLLSMMFKLQNTVAVQGTDPVKYQDAMIVAQRKSQAVIIPQLKYSSVSNQVADPDSVQKQSDAQIALEKYRQGFNVSSDLQRQSETNLSFTQDAITQDNNANSNFWQTMSKLLREVQNL